MASRVVMDWEVVTAQVGEAYSLVVVASEMGGVAMEVAAVMGTAA